MLARPRPMLLLTACGLALLVLTTPASAGARYTLTNLGAIGGDEASHAYGINDAGQVVGYSQYANGGDRAFLYEDGTIIDLNTVIAPVPGLTLRDATAINDQGQIVGFGADARGNNFAFLLTPTAVPEPSSIALMSLGLADLAGVALRRRGRTPR